MDCAHAAASDASLMARVVAGDQLAFRLLAGRHAGRIIAVAQRIVGSAAEADEIAQETLLLLWQRTDQWDPARAPLATWLYRIACNLSIDRARRRRIFDPLEPAEDIADPRPSAADAMIDREQRTRLAAALAALPPRQRAAIALFYDEELSGEQAAAALGVSLQGLWSLLLRGRRSLARRLRID